MATFGNVEDPPKKTLKRKRPWSILTLEEKQNKIKGLNEETQGLIEYYKEMIANQRLSVEMSECCSSLNGSVAVLMEESELPLSKLVDQIFVKLEEKGEMGLNLAAVKSAVLFVGQRIMYGVPNLDADVLEDDTEACLWCWETRDIKLLPKSVRGTLKIRRTCRKKICERITAISAMLTTLQRPEGDLNFTHDVMKASAKLEKALSEADIRMLVDSMSKKSTADIAEKDVKREEKLLIRQLERNKRKMEKEKKRVERELEKEKLQNEKELKRLQEESEKDEKRREKEESEMRKQLRKQQEEAERNHRRKEKEEAELKKQLALRKQASIMERFLKRSKITSPCQNDQASAQATRSSCKKTEEVPAAVTVSMDHALSTNDEIKIDDLFTSHLASWHQYGHSIRTKQYQHWGMRRKPKTELFKELKLTTNRALASDNELSMDKSIDRWEEQTFVDSINSSDYCHFKKHNRRQLLQFDKCNRPAFYGIWPKKSYVVGPRHPLKKDPDLDYDIDSDEEWEEEDPGESLSDCDNDDEEERLEEDCSKVEDEVSEDGFFVPDGYLSEDEGVQVDRNVDELSDATNSSPRCKQDFESEESYAPVRQQKHLHHLTEHALRKNRPLIISNIMHEKAPLLLASDLTGTSKMEQACLQALSMRPFPGGLLVEVSINRFEDEDQEVCLSNSKGKTTQYSVGTTLESELPTIVSGIQSCTLGISKIVECLQQKLPDIPKCQLRNKVREISDFTDNRWQVKKEILIKHGLPASPEKSGGRSKSIASFFSKRCLPPSDCKSMNLKETLPVSSVKSGSDVRGHIINDV